MHHWGHMLAAAALVVGLAALLVARYWAHQKSMQDIYSAVVKSHWARDAGEFVAPANDNSGLFATHAQIDTLLAAAEEGACWSNSLYTAVNVWSVLAVLLLAMLLFYHVASNKYFQ
jgi:hypothetical protein